MTPYDYPIETLGFILPAVIFLMLWLAGEADHANAEKVNERGGTLAQAEGARTAARDGSNPPSTPRSSTSSVSAWQSAAWECFDCGEAVAACMCGDPNFVDDDWLYEEEAQERLREEDQFLYTLPSAWQTDKRGTA